MVQLGIDKSKLGLFKKTKKQILNEIKPSTSQNIKEKRFVDDILKRINKTKGLHKEGIIAGSFARNTNLKESKDFDIFVLYPIDTDKEDFVREGLELGKSIFKGYFWEKAYSQHPYIRGIIDGYKVEIVPAYAIEDTSELKSAVDRTPFHLQYLLKTLKNSQKDEVRLLKYFLRKIDCYGADSQFQGFSGYLCELLILKYGDFLEVLKNVSNWKLPIKFALETNQILFLDKFDDPLIVIDPVDSNRNVASAVSKTTLSKFIASSRAFLENPDIFFFNKRIVRQLTYHQLVGKIDQIPLAVLQVETKDLLKDVVWSKLRRLAKKLIVNLNENDFSILKYDIYYKENEDFAYIFLMLNSLVRPKLKLNVGPKVSDIIHSNNFITNNRAHFGPYIKGEYWYSIKIRSKVELKPVINEFLFNNFKLPTKLYVDKEIRDLYLKDNNISYYFSKFFVNKEEFLI